MAPKESESGFYPPDRPPIDAMQRSPRAVPELPRVGFFSMVNNFPYVLYRFP
jgi:hypothetical protein